LEKNFLGLRESTEPALRWDNIERSPLWVGGIPPDYKPGKHMHLVNLTPGANVTVHIPAREILRITAPNGELTTDDLLVWVSNGSTLFKEISPVLSQDGKSLLVFPPPAYSYLVTLTRPSPFKTAAEIGLFVSRHEAKPTANLPGFQPLRHLPGKSVSLLQTNRTEPDRYWFPPNEGKKILLRVTGPIQLQIETRRFYTRDDSEVLQPMWLIARLDGKFHKLMEYRTAVEERSPVRVNDKILPVGKEGLSFLSVPPGQHLLEIEGNAPFYYRVSSLDSSKLKFPKNISQKAKALTTLEVTGYGRVENNSLRDSSLAAAVEMQQAADNDFHDRLLSSLARDFYYHHTFYRQLHPWKTGEKARQVSGYFLIPSLLSPDESVPHPTYFPQFVDTDLEDLPSGTFYRVTPGPLEYRLPGRKVPSTLRIALQCLTTSQSAPTHIYIRFDEKPPQRLIFFPVLPFKPRYVYLSPLEKAIEKNDLRDEALNLWGKQHSILPLLKVATAEIPLPEEVRSVRVWVDEGVPYPVDAAMHYRASNSFKLDETQFLAGIKLVKPSITDFFPFFCADKNHMFFPVFQALQHDLEPLVRLFKARCSLFLEGQNFNSNLSLQGKAALPAAKIEELYRESLAAETAGNWYEALEKWNALLYDGDASKRIEALWGRIRALTALDEPFLAEQHLKTIMFQEKDMSLKKEAAKKLRQLYAPDEREEEKQLINDMAEAWMDPSAETMGRVCDNMVRQGLYEEALRLGLLLPAGQRPGNLVVAAFAKSNRHILNHLTGELPKPKQALWNGLLKIKDGDVEKGINQIEEAGNDSEARQWLVWLREGTGLRRDVMNGVPPLKIDLLRRWEAWQSKYPGPWMWKSAEAAITDCDGIEQVYNLELDMASTYYRCTGERHGYLEAYGPCRLKFQLRPLFDDYNANKDLTALFDWMQIEVDGGSITRYVPVNRNLPNPGLERVGAVGLKMGEKEEAVITLGPGFHRIRVIPGKTHAAVRVFQYIPALDMGLLPLLTGEVRRRFFGRQGNEPARIETPGQETARAEMEKLVFEAEQDREGSQSRVGSAAQYYYANSARAYLTDLFQRLRQFSRWEPVTSFTQSAGMIPVVQPTGRATSPFPRIRLAMLPPQAESIILNSSDTVETTLYYPGYSRSVRVELTLLTPDFQKPFPLPVSIRLNGEKVSLVTLSGSNTPFPVSVQIPQGRNTLRIDPDRYLVNHYINIRLFEKIGPNQWVQIKEDNRTYFEIGSKEQPLHMKMAGPAWLRVDSWNDQKKQLFFEYRTIPAGEHEISFEKDSSSPDTLVGYRLYKKVFSPLLQASVEEPLRQPLAPLPFVPFSPASSSPVKLLEDGFALGGQEDGTPSASMGYFSRRILDEEEDSIDRFLQLTLSKRKFNPHKNFYSLAEAFMRIRERPTAGLHYNLFYAPDVRKHDIEMDAVFYFQDTRRIPSAGSINWSIRVSGTYRLRYYIGSRVSYMPGIQLFYRQLGPGAEPDFDFTGLDPDIYTRYKGHHRYGVILENSLSIKPDDDTRLWFYANAASNENFNLFAPDYITFQAGLKQRLRWITLSFDYRWRFYFKDDSRENPFNQRFFTLRFTLDYWFRNLTRVELGGFFTLEPRTERKSFSLFLSWHLGRGRAYRDFSTREIEFKKQRQQQLQEQGRCKNNKIKE